jgi:hypothetical protein
VAEVVAFEQRRERPPVATLCEFRLDRETYALELTLFDDQGGVFIVPYRLEGRPPNFVLSLFAEAWDRWFGTSAAAS